MNIESLNDSAVYTDMLLSFFPVRIVLTIGREHRSVGPGDPAFRSLKLNQNASKLGFSAR